MILDGKVTNVFDEDKGSKIEGDQLAGTTVVSIIDAYEFNGNGGNLNIIDDYVYLSSDPENDTVTLPSPGLLVDVEDGEDVLILPIGRTRKAHIDLDDDSEGVEAVVPWDWQDSFPTGIRDNDDQEAVLISDETGTWTIIALDGEIPLRDGSYTDPNTLPDPTIPTDPPASSPAISAFGTAEAVILTTEPVASSSWITYEISLNGGGQWDALPDMPTRSNVYTVAKDSTGGPLQQDVEYLFRAIAGNVVGDATPSASVIGKLDPDRVTDVVLGRLVAGIVMAGRFESGNGYWDPDEGLVLPQPNGLVTRLSTDGVTPSVLAGEFIAEFMTLIDGEITGDVDVFGLMKYLSGIGPPKSPPTLSNVWDYKSIIAPAGYDQAAFVSGLYGLTESADGNSWISVLSGVNPFSDVVVSISKTTGQATALFAVPFQSRYGVVLHGGNYVVAYKDGSDYVIQRRTTGGTIVEQKTLSGANTFDPFLGSDGTALLWAKIIPAPEVEVWRVYTDATVNTYDATLDGSAVGGTFGILQSNADVGVARIWHLANGSTNVNAHNTGGISASTHSFKAPESSGAGRGIWYAGGKFHVLSNTGKVYEMGPQAAAGTDYFSHSWYNSLSPFRETPVGPVASKTRVNRAKVLVSCTPPPQAGESGATVANQTRIYGGTSATTTNHDLLATLGAGVNSQSFNTPPAVGGAAPKTVNGFNDVAAPGEAQSEAQAGGLPTWFFKGDGNWRAGPVTGTPTGGTVNGGFVPIGVVVDTVSDVADDGYLMLTGPNRVASFSSVTYPELATRVGDKVAPHSGTTYYLPDLRRRFVWGADSDNGVPVGFSDLLNPADRNPQHAHSDGTLSTGSPNGTRTVQQGSNTNIVANNHDHDVTGITGNAGQPGGSTASNTDRAFPNFALNKMIRAA